MNRIIKYQESISKFLKTKSCFSTIIKSNPIYESIIANSDHLLPIILLTILSNQTKNKDLKSHHGYYMSSGIDILMCIVMILDNEVYYNNKYGKTNITNFITEMPIYISTCVSQNIETMESSVDKEKILKIFHTSINYIQSKIQLILSRNNMVKYNNPDTNVKKTDIIKFKFNDKTIIKNKYKNLKQVDRQSMLTYIETKYGSVCECSFVMGWLLSAGEMKNIDKFEALGISMGYVLKISNDFYNLERDIKYSDTLSNNFIVNYGIHACFSIFIENKIKLIEGCLKLDILTNTIQEIFDYIENKFDKCIANTDIELQSLYSDFTDNTNPNTNPNTNKTKPDLINPNPNPLSDSVANE